jgi:hypothetical protein
MWGQQARRRVGASVRRRVQGKDWHGGMQCLVARAWLATAVENRITTSVSSYGFLQAVRTHGKGYENLHG